MYYLYTKYFNLVKYCLVKMCSNKYPQLMRIFHVISFYITTITYYKYLFMFIQSIMKTKYGFH